MNVHNHSQMNTNYFLRIFIVKHVFLIRRKIFLSKAFTKTITVILSFLERERERERTVNVILQSFQSIILYSMIVAYRSPSLTVPDRYSPFLKRPGTVNDQGWP
jgi:hypothetical protein